MGRPSSIVVSSGQNAPAPTAIVGTAKGYPGVRGPSMAQPLLISGGSCNPGSAPGSQTSRRNRPSPAGARGGRISVDALDRTQCGHFPHAIVDLTRELERFCADLGDGLVNVFVPHATAGLALMETGSGSEADLLAALDRLLPRDSRYQHAHGSPGHGADHLLPALVSPSTTIPVLGGRMALGTWQSLVLVDLNADNPGDMCDSASSRHSRTPQPVR